MKTGTKILIAVLTLGLVYLVYWIFRTVSNLKKIKFQVGRVRLSDKDKAKAKEVRDAIEDIDTSDLESLLENAPLILKAFSDISIELEVKANNFTGQDFKVTQVYAEVRSKASGNVIARVESPLEKPAPVTANRTSSIWIPIQINTLNVITTAGQGAFIAELMKAIVGKPADFSNIVELNGFVQSGWFRANFTK